MPAMHSARAQNDPSASGPGTSSEGASGALTSGVGASGALTSGVGASGALTSGVSTSGALTSGVSTSGALASGLLASGALTSITAGVSSEGEASGGGAGAMVSPHPAAKRATQSIAAERRAILD
jgi:hypothetical protein